MLAVRRIPDKRLSGSGCAHVTNFRIFFTSAESAAHTFMSLPSRLQQYVVCDWSYGTLPYLTLSYFTLPYLTGKTFCRLALRPSVGPLRIPELFTMLQNPHLTWVHTNNGTKHPPLQMRTAIFGLTHYHTLSVSPRAHQPWSCHNDLRIRKQENPGDPCPELNIKLQKIPKCDTHLASLQNWNHSLSD